ncbi:ABC transporter ATP-binding protein [Pseudonocardia sp. HH130630-07]|uniref:ABC transporter ATP-binding protein n=1 Tax=Pseudonocardia sp. HH130630-07 TaxID=1690815 RepID=UPI000814B98F|nr:ABC transporter ATP-binding protein [Pseudonocardia sp. HH130630-07]ANY08755.1 ABC transporter ATP-binding protein [Pseudonocardia sp. HH130630-07]
MHVLPGSRGRTGPLVALLSAGLLLGTAPVAVAATGDDGGSVAVTEERVAVPAGGGAPGTVDLDTSLYVPASAAADPAPAVLVAHGFGGSKRSVDRDARELAARGYVVQTWTARGLGGSGGTIGLNDPDREVADASRLVDRLAARPDVQRDADGDPRVGVTGGSYGGGLTLSLAGRDDRIDAIAPVITWNDLGQSLFPNNAVPAGTELPGTPAAGAGAPDGVFKSGWAGVFFGSGGEVAGGGDAGAAAGQGSGAPGSGTADDGTGGSDDGSAGGTDTSGGGPDGAAGASGSGHPGGTGAAAAGPGGASGPGTTGPDTPGATGPGAADGAPAPGGGQVTCGRFAPDVCAAYTEAARSGRASPELDALLRRSSPATVTDRITAPTLLVQGEQDTLFGLDQADANARQIAAHGTPVSVLWFAGGHDGSAPDSGVRDRIGDWFDRHLRGLPAADGVSGALAEAPFAYQVRSTVRTRGDTPTGRTVLADGYPGLTGAPVPSVAVPLAGDEQIVAHPPGGNPATVTSLPGLGSALGSLGSLSALAAPGQSARFVSEPVAEALQPSGAPQVTAQISRVPGQQAPETAVLFASATARSPEGRSTLLGNAVAPLRVAVPADGSPATVRVTLPGVVAPVTAGSRLEVQLATTDQAYASGTDPAVWRVGLGDGGTLSVPQVPGRTESAGTVPLWPVLGIGGVLVAALAAWLVLRARARRADPGNPAETTGPGPDDTPPLQVTGLAKTYRNGFRAVSDVSLTVPRGAVLGLLGPNGAGKTTVLRMLLGMIAPTSGEMRAFGRPIRPGAAVLSRIGAFVEGPGFLPHLSGAENLRLYWEATGRPIGQARMDETLEIAGLGDSVHRRVGTYSQGMRQRLAIAQAMLGLPELLILDEPTNGLDPPQIHAMRELLRRYASGGRTVLVSSHLLSEVEQTCTDVVVMHRGTVVAAGTVAELTASGGGSSFTVDATAAAATVLAGIEGVSEIVVGDEPGVVHAHLEDVARADAVAALVGAGIAVSAAGPRGRLEDAFLELVGPEGRDVGSGS